MTSWKNLFNGISLLWRILTERLSVKFHTGKIAAADSLQHDSHAKKEDHTGHQAGGDGVLAALSKIECGYPDEDADKIADECNDHQDFLVSFALFQIDVLFAEWSFARREAIVMF